MIPIFMQVQMGFTGSGAPAGGTAGQLPLVSVGK